MVAPIIALLLKIGALIATAIGGAFAVSQKLSPNNTTAIETINNTAEHIVETTNTNLNYNVTTPTGDAINAVKHVPWNDVWDMIFDGTLNVARYISNFIITPLITHTMRFATGDQTLTMSPLWGYLIFAIIMIIILYTQWQNIFTFVHKNFMWVIIIMVVVFLLGIILGYMQII